MRIASNLIGKSFTEFATENANYYNLDQSANISRMQFNYRFKDSEAQRERHDKKKARQGKDNGRGMKGKDNDMK